MTRQTSIDAYNDIKESGLLGRLSEEVYRIVAFYGPLTAQEAWKIMKEDLHVPIVNNRRDGITQRFSELERRGAIKIVGKGICSVSGRLVYKWEITGNRPVKLDKPKTIKCKHCNGKGKITEQQMRMF